jgi:tetratricopeptide (TPR) repeat protein
MQTDGYRGARRVYGWSFYSQGAREDAQASADPFIAAALAWFGDPDPTAGSPWDKGERLAELVRREKTLLVLDGLEPLQYPPGEMEGRLKDPGLKCLLRELARHNPGLCVLTTRLEVGDLAEFVGGPVTRVCLEHLSPQTGAAYLARLGVEGAQEEMEQAAEEFDGHALALTLLGRYLATVHAGDVRQRDQIARLTEERIRGGHARRVMETYERWLAGKPALDVLRLMGLFDRPAAGGALQALRAEPPIPELTESLHTLSHADWQFAVADLRKARLLAEADPASPDTLDCHPLVREHFGEKLAREHPEAWRKAHGRLYEYYKAQAPDLPDTLEEMLPLYAAVTHGCRAGRHQEAFTEVYERRVLRGNEYFSWNTLGSFGADLASLSGFFDSPWRRVVAELKKSSRAYILNAAGFDLRALGRLAEAIQPMQAALETDILLKDWVSAARDACNLSELHLTLGDLYQTLIYAEQSVDLADRSGDAFMRMVMCTVLANTLHQAGRIEEAEALFEQAETIQKEDQPRLPVLFLYSLRGYQYCDLLLGQGQTEEVQRRATQSIEIAQQNNWLLDIALDHLSLGRAHLLQAQGTPSTAHLNRAVDGLRQAGTQHHIPRGLLARAALFRAQDQFDRSQHDLDEALAIATRGGMRLFEADCHLECARLHLARGDEDAARKGLAQAREMIAEMGYHRQDGEVAELEEALGENK